MTWRLGLLFFSQWGNFHAASGDGRLGATGRTLFLLMVDPAAETIY